MSLIPILLLTFCAHLHVSDTDKVKMIVRVTGIEENTGQIMIAVFNTEDSFLGPEAFEGKIFKVDSEEQMDCPIMLPHGDYAISIFHDVNGNGKLDTGTFGIPNEPYGFSNNARGWFGPPKYKDCLFSFDQADQVISIRVK